MVIVDGDFFQVLSDGSVQEVDTLITGFVVAKEE
jgi:hypothetical protein